MKNKKRPKSSIEQLENRNLLAADPWSTVGFDMATGVETVFEKASHPEISDDIRLRGFEGTKTWFDTPDGKTIDDDGFLETVHGSDDRILVTGTSSFPFRTIVKLNLTFPNGSGGGCSGALVDSFHVLTAGHCIHSADDGGFASSVRVSPGKDADEYWYGTANSTYLRTYTGWTQNQDTNHDWGLITLDRSVGDFTGWMGREVLAESSFDNGVNLNTAGYPGDLDGGQRMYRAFGPTTSATDTRVLYSGLNGLDTAGGQSGSALYRYVSSANERYINTIHTTGSSTLNGGTRLNTDKYNRLNTWISDDQTARLPTERADLVDYDDVLDTNLASISTTSALPGDSFNATAYVRNNGTATASNYQVRFYASTNSIISSSDTLLGTTTIASTPAYEWDSASLSTTLPSLSSGVYYIGWIIDAGGSVSEYSESNNTGYASQQLTVLQDDHGNSAPASTVFTSSVSGNIQSANDSDWFSFTAAEGQQIVLETSLGSLSDSTLQLFGTNGTTSLAFDDDGGTGLASRIAYTLPSNGTYYARVDGLGSSTGTYTLTFTHIDDHTNAYVGASPATVDRVGSGVVGASGDSDYFSFAAIAGHDYVIETALDSLGDSTLQLLSTNGTTQLDFDDDSGNGLASRIEWTAPGSGTYYFAVRGHLDSVGTYDVSVSDFTFPQIAFAASRSDGQVELFKSRGNATDATGLLKNVGGSQSSNPHGLTVVGDSLFFAATGADGEIELFRTDAAGNTARVKDLAGAISSNPHELIENGGLLYFAARGPDGDVELYKSDGTNTGTVRVKNLSGTTSADPRDLTVMNGLLYFTALSTTGQRELYVSDGTGPGTQRVKNLGGESVSSDPSNLTVVGNTLYFVATTDTLDRELHKSDGTAAGTVLVEDIAGPISSLPRSLTPYNGELVFRARGADGQTELWKSDGTSAGTVLVKDFYGNSANSNPRAFSEFNGQLYFAAVDPSGQAELHVTDGTTVGSQLFVDLHGAASSLPNQLTVVGANMFFTAVAGDGQRELYVTDGSVAGTQRVKNIAGATSSEPKNLTAVGDTLYFTATLANGDTELFRSDGTAAGTVLVKNLGGDPTPKEIVPFSLDLPLGVLPQSPFTVPDVSSFVDASPAENARLNANAFAPAIRAAHANPAGALSAIDRVFATSHDEGDEVLSNQRLFQATL